MSVQLPPDASLDQALDTYYQWDPHENKIGARSGYLSSPGDRDSEFCYYRPRADIPGLFSDHDKCRLLVLRGVVQGDFADTLYRAASFARVVAAGRAHAGASHAATAYDSDLSASRLLTLAEQLENAAALEIDGLLA